MSIAWGDVDGDGDPDLAVGNFVEPSKIYTNQHGTLDANASQVFADGDYTFGLAWGDIDGDGDLDLAAGNSYQPNRVYLNQNGTLDTMASWYVRRIA